MSIVFIYMNNRYEIKENNKDLLINNIIIKYSILINQNIENLKFIYKGKVLSRRNKLKIKVFNNFGIIILVINLNLKKKLKKKYLMK